MKEIALDKVGGKPPDGDNLFLSILVALIVTLYLSTSTLPALIKPILLDGSLISNGRFAMTYEGYETVADDNTVTVVGIGSSVLMAAMDGECMQEQTGIPNARFYNFAMSGAYPYSEMVQVPALIEAEPDVVLIEIGPNSLWGWSGDIWTGAAEYNEFRFQLISMTMSSRHIGDWYYILEPEDRVFIDTTQTKIMDAWSEYTRDAIEEYLTREIDDMTNALVVTSYSYVPPIGSDEWDAYLSKPNWRESKFEEKTPEEIIAYFDEVMPAKSKQGVYNPQANGTQNHQALDYTIHELLNASIDVVLIGAPHHPLVNDYLKPGQLDGMNETYTHYSQFEGVTPLQMYWDEWSTEAFSDRNHLDSDGREIFCERVTPIVDSIISTKFN
ncbi:hypothetical protein OAV27_00810 [Euryarchaeota archaeon]|nr:hypothetical protein [Euryarchaeota archaeon]